MESTLSASAPALDKSKLTRLFAATFCHFVSMGMYMAAVPLFVHYELGASRALVGLAVGAFFPGAILMRPIIGNEPTHVRSPRTHRRPLALSFRW